MGGLWRVALKAGFGRDPCRFELLWKRQCAEGPFHITPVVSLIFRSRVSGSLPVRDGGIPRWGTIDLQIDDHLLEFSAIGLAHLVLHERLRTFLPHLVVQ